MSTSDFLRLHLRLLVSQFGRRSVLDALADVSGVSPEKIDTEIAAHEEKKRAKAPKHDKSLEELLRYLRVASEEVKKVIADIGHLYETKQFLPNLRDAEEFLRRTDASSKKFKSRRAALGAVLKVLSEMTLDELQSLLTQITSSHGQSDYSLLANQLMGKGR